jgi:hypothetical protein
MRECRTILINRIVIVADEIWREYQAVLACSGGEDPETADDRVTGG